jgi:hypothetical protein
MLSLYYADRDAVLEAKDGVLRVFAELLEDTEFDVMIARATADRARVFGRIRAFSEKLEDLGIRTSFRDAIPQE